MIARWLMTAALATLILTCRGAAQSVPQLLEKGIYTQETVGDLDRAIEIYRQIVSAVPQNRSYAAQAQYRLAESLLQKGDKVSAALEFRRMIESYADAKDLVAKARQAIMPLASFVDGQYSDPVIGISFASPEWTIAQVSREEDGSVVVSLHALYGAPRYPNRVDFPEVMARKSKMPSIQALYEEYPKSRCEHCVNHILDTREIKGWQVLSFAGETTTDWQFNKGVPTVNYRVLIETGKTEVQIGAFVPEKDLERTKAIIDKIIDSMQMP